MHKKYIEIAWRHLKKRRFHFAIDRHGSDRGLRYCCVAQVRAVAPAVKAAAGEQHRRKEQTA